MSEAERIIRELGLTPHPEGGHFVEVFRSPATVIPRHGAARSASTAIYFLLKAGEFSAFHRVSSDEAWHHYGGDALELHTLDERGHQITLLGRELGAGERPLHVVPAGSWQAARPTRGPAGYALCGCTVAPGFEFQDFEMPGRATLIALFPDVDIVRALTR